MLLQCTVYTFHLAISLVSVVCKEEVVLAQKVLYKGPSKTEI